MKFSDQVAENVFAFLVFLFRNNFLHEHFNEYIIDDNIMSEVFQGTIKTHYILYVLYGNLSVYGSVYQYMCTCA